MASLLRRCEQKQPHRNAACSLFWTLGGNQVGKAALSGWRVLQQQPADELRIWPFDGKLNDLLLAPGIVVAETYPTEFYGHLGLPSVIGKRKQDNRSAASRALLRAAERLDIALHPELREQIVDGFGHSSSGEDAFDAMIGLLGMINVIAGERSPGEPRDDPSVLRVEGWILGQAVDTW